MKTCPHGLTETCSKCHGYSDNTTTPGWEEEFQMHFGGPIKGWRDGITTFPEVAQFIAKQIKTAEERTRLEVLAALEAKLPEKATERNMAKLKTSDNSISIELETVGEVTAWNFYRTAVLKIIGELKNE